MPKITTSNTKNLFLTYAIKIVLSTVLTLFVLSSIFSFITLKLDLDLKLLEYFSVAICGISSIIISFISISGFKNNYLILSVISIIPLVLFSVINYCVNKQGSFGLELAKIAIILVVAVLTAVFKSTKKLR